MPRLIVIRGADEGKQFELTGSVVGVGRDAANPVRLHDTEVSRRHAEFRQTSQGYRLIDIGSANGTFVNNQQVKDVLLRPGDHVEIGQSVLVYSDNRQGASSASDLADQISMISRQDLELSSAIIKTVSEGEGSRILAEPDQVKGAWLKARLANLAVMYEASQAVSHILDVNQLLDKILELIFQSIEADRGCIMLRQPSTGQLEPKAVRWSDAGSRHEKMTVSRTIMDYVLREKKGVLISDATQDERFSAGQSIVRFGIREVICVPMKGRHETLGVLYLDTRSTTRDLVARNSDTGKFTEDHLSLAIAIAHQAALAVEETRYHQALVQAERLAAVGQTIAALSHHIKNILQGLRSGNEILRMGLAEKSETLLERGLALVEKNQGKIYDLVMDMLNYSKEREPAFEECALNSIARDVLELLEGRAQELGIKLETAFADLPPVQADPEGIHRALLNIISNAFDAVENQPEPEVTVATRMEADGSSVQIVVTDNGVGIPPDKLPDIFKPFVSSKGSRGTGLGLAVSRKILREHGGDITVQSTPGQGSCFLLRLPVKNPLHFDSGRTSDDLRVPPPADSG